MTKIQDIIAREILDSRGNPTVEVELFLDNMRKVRASVPSGASTGSKEVLELRDKDVKRYQGLGVLKAVENINKIIKPNLIGIELNQLKIDRLLVKLDGTKLKNNLGGNAILAVSLATLKACAISENKNLYQYVNTGTYGLPIPMMNIINGGKHSNNGVAFQEFMIVPVVKTFKERLRVGAEIFHVLKKILETNNISSSVGDEGGFSPKFKNNEMALSLINKAIMAAGYIPGKDVYIAIDVAATSFYLANQNCYLIDGKAVSAKKLIEYYKYLIDKYPIISIEDPFEENDFDSLKTLTKEIGDKIMIVGDDYFVTNKELLKKGIENKCANAILLKANQIGTISEMIETINLAKKNNYNLVISHRSGETEDTFIADLAVGLNIPFIKTGSLCRGERIAKYNQLLRIEEEITK